MTTLELLDPAAVFRWASVLAIFGWVLLAAAAFVPEGAQRDWCVRAGGTWVPALLCLIYAITLVQHWSSAPGGHFGSLHGVVTLFASSGKLLGGWIHFLAFDLLVGGWVIRQVLAIGQPRWWLCAVLPLLFMFGPVGWLVYRLASAAHGAAPRQMA
ncbi:ABA4-like family protein [Ottowia testudinis]|uniref:DUF4281 domain-containing protein n=1 Tax=Ottowia testudinis TaxID=2816950 RepID=A0A975H3V2_9BURK|nr:ABA4-like family protein [Ottowia testudinis]QTD46263.1 DUF4281 domain-containing protein [Ottowia testudinis]